MSQGCAGGTTLDDRSSEHMHKEAWEQRLRVEQALRKSQSQTYLLGAPGKFADPGSYSKALHCVFKHTHQKRLTTAGATSSDCKDPSSGASQTEQQVYEINPVVKIHKIPDWASCTPSYLGAKDQMFGQSRQLKLCLKK